MSQLELRAVRTMCRLERMKLAVFSFKFNRLMATTNKVLQKAVFSGIQPTGFIHLGNYLGAVKNWVHLQEQNDLSRYFCVVDYHSITQRYVGKHLEDAESHPKDNISIQNSVLQTDDRPEELTLKTAATLLACGIDPN